VPKRTDIKKILLIGSGPIVIGQACEFDYSGTQAIKALKKEGYEVILVNSNPATIMTDPDIADRTYIEPLKEEFLEKIIEKERPDAILPTMGGQTALNLAIELHKKGVLDKFGIELIGANINSIQKAENRQLFTDTMDSIGLPVAKGGVVHSLKEALELVKVVGYPAIIRPSFTLGGSGGNIANNLEEYKSMVEWGLQQSPTHEILIEQSVIGWKEFELEVMRDKKDNVVIICSIENFDPMGVHTGDSITVAPIQTLTDVEYQKLRDAAIKIIRAIGVDTGGSNIQFAMNPKNGDLLVIEMNPRVSRSSALASKATGFPIAKIAALLSIGYTLDEIPNEITLKTPACFEPALDYVVVKIPRWNFEKFQQTEPVLTTQMKSVGESMSIGRTFKEAFQKAIRSLETGRMGLGADGKEPMNIYKLSAKEKEEQKTKIKERLKTRYFDNIFYIKLALQLGISIDEIYAITGVDPWFLSNILQIVGMEQELYKYHDKVNHLPADLLKRAKQYGYSDFQIAYLTNTTERRIRNIRKEFKIIPVYKMVDTCAGEFSAKTTYFYSNYDDENESISSENKKVIVLGSGPNRIGQGIEFDYCCVHCIMAIREKGIEAIMVNSNPETVSTDYDIADKLYFEPLTFEDVMNIIELENPDGVIIQFGGQTPLKLAKNLQEEGVPILGTSPDMIDLAEDRKQFGELLTRLEIDCPPFETAINPEDLIQKVKKIGFPVLIRPSYVLGGRAMEIVYDHDSLNAHIEKVFEASQEHPVLVDRFLEDAFEFDVDALCDGEEVLIGGVMQHIEEAGIHSGDSAAVLPAYMISPKHEILIREYTTLLAKNLNVIGLINIQYALRDEILYVLEVNPRASRTVPFVSKSIGKPLAKLATYLTLGDKIADFSFHKEIIPNLISVKESVLPFHKFPGTLMYLGPEMKSTGEVMGISNSLGKAFAKATFSTGATLPTKGTVLISVNDRDKKMIVPIARNFVQLGFKIYATAGTAKALKIQGIEVETTLRKLHEGDHNIVDAIKNNEIDIVINTPMGKESRSGESKIGMEAIRANVLMITTLSAALAAISGIEAMQKEGLEVRCLQDNF
jgi:carbamoyl-phosphate synthase large subunit